MLQYGFKTKQISDTNFFIGRIVLRKIQHNKIQQKNNL